MMSDEQELVTRIQNDPGAFQELVDRYKRQMYCLGLDLTGNHHDAEDLAQEVFVRAWKGLRTFRGDSAFRTWLHRVAINVVRTSQSRTGRWRQMFTDSTDEAPDVPSRDEPVDAALARRQVIELALAALPEELRVAVTLRDLQGLDYREIAELLNVPIGTVESRIFRARQRLKPLLAPLLTAEK